MLVVACIAFVGFATLAHADEDGWIEDYAKAKEIAKKENKLILADFTGSDWCGWCKKLDREVFTKSEFKEYVKDKFVLLKVDFPQRRELSAETKKQNDELGQKFNIEGYPTILVIDATGKEKSRLGYMEGGPAAFDAELKKAL